MYCKYATLSQHPKVFMMESSSPFFAAVVAAQILKLTEILTLVYSRSPQCQPDQLYKPFS